MGDGGDDDDDDDDDDDTQLYCSLVEVYYVCNSHILPLAMQHAGHTQASSVTHIPVQHMFNFVHGCNLTSHFCMMTLEKYPVLYLENETISSHSYHAKALSKVSYSVELLVLEVQLHAFLTWALDGDEPSASHCGCFSVRQAAVYAY